jgi:hypothetical protein
MAWWPTDNEAPFNAQFRWAELCMSSQMVLRGKIVAEMSNFQRTLDELRLLKKASRDLQKFKKMVPLKKFD